ncbi:MAG: hypothetical protein IKU26_01175 [Clostridia bacterium]|nr:hypothetical protein [Clostridia bacterium]
MLDLREETKNFKPIDIGSLSSDEGLYTESMRIAFTLYNKALKDIQDGYRDMARNNLRKAVSHYPEFGDAMIVLGICMFVGGDRIGAVRLFNSIKRPEDRKRGLEVLDHLAAAPDYIPQRSKETTPIENRSVPPVRERPVFGKYSEPTSMRHTTSHTAETDFIPAEIRPASRMRESGEDSIRARGVRSKYQGTHRQELMGNREQENVLPPKQSDVTTERKETELPKVSEVQEPIEESKKRVRLDHVWGENSLLVWILMLLAAFTILAGTLWMHTHAQNQKLRAELKKVSAVWVVDRQ